MRVYGIRIVFTDKNHWCLLQGGKIQAFMESAFVRGSIAEEVDHNGSRLLNLKRVCETNRLWNRRTNDRRCTHDTSGHVDEVHRATFSFRAASGFAIELGNHFFEVTALG